MFIGVVSTTNSPLRCIGFFSVCVCFFPQGYTTTTQAICMKFYKGVGHWSKRNHVRFVVNLSSVLQTVWDLAHFQSLHFSLLFGNLDGKACTGGWSLAKVAVLEWEEYWCKLTKNSLHFVNLLLIWCLLKQLRRINQLVNFPIVNQGHLVKVSCLI